MGFFFFTKASCWDSSRSVPYIAQKTIWSTLLTAWNNNHATEDTNDALFPQQKELQFISAVRKQADQLQYSEFCLWCTRPPLWPAPLPPLCFLEYLEWVLYEKAYLKKDLRDHWLSLTAVQLCPLSTALNPPTPRSSNLPATHDHHSPKPWHHSRNVYNSASSYCTAVKEPFSGFSGWCEGQFSVCEVIIKIYFDTFRLLIILKFLWMWCNVYWMLIRRWKTTSLIRKIKIDLIPFCLSLRASIVSLLLPHPWDPALHLPPFFFRQELQMKGRPSERQCLGSEVDLQAFLHSCVFFFISVSSQLFTCESPPPLALSAWVLLVQLNC